MKGGEDDNGDQESPGKEGEEDHEEEIARLNKRRCVSFAVHEYYHEESLRGFVFLRACFG